MAQPDSSQSEIDLVYNASSQLIHASNPLEQLEAVSDYARSTGASRGILVYCGYQGDDRIDEIVAEWVTGDTMPVGVGTQFYHSHPILDPVGSTHPPPPVFFQNTLDDARISATVRELDQHYSIISCAMLPLYSNGRWIATITFGWDHVREFDEREKRFYTILQQLAAPVIDSTRLFAHTQDHVAELETTRREIEFLNETSRLLAGATSPTELLQVIRPYMQERGAVSGHIFYFDQYQPNWIEVVAVWGVDIKYCLPVAWRLDIAHRKLGQYWTSHPDKPTFISDVMNSDDVGEDSVAILRQYNVRGLAALPFNHHGRWIGAAYFFWNRPHVLDERDVRIITAIQQNAAPAIDSIRLLDQSRARTLDLEKANQEINLLYRTSETINGANTLQGVVEAVSQFDPEAEVVTLMLWDTLNWVTANYLDVVVVIDRTGQSQLEVGSQLPKDNFPIAKVMLGERVWLFDDAHEDPRIDPVTAQSWELLNIRSFAGPALYINQHWAGGITFQSSKPRKFTERDKRLLAGVGDLVVAAILRIRSQQETLVAKEEADTLYRVGEAINAANTFTELVNALSGIITGAIAIALYSWEGWNFETATYVEMVAATDHLLPMVGHRTPKEELSYTHHTQGDRLMVLEDIVVDVRLEDSTVQNYVNRQLLAAISIRLYVKQCWIGALVFHSKVPRSFSDRERRLALGVGDYVLGAVERIRAREETEAARQRAEALAEQAHQLAVLEERNRLARELHDSVSQALYGIVLGAQTARTFLDRDPQKSIEPLDYVLSLSEAGLAEMRALIFELRPETLEKEGLIEALSKQVTMLKARHGLDVRTYVDQEPDIALHLKEAVYWIAREALYNIVKHAHASVVEISMTCSSDLFTLKVIDNGVGFDMDGDFSGHLGLRSMSERAQKISGLLRIDSHSGSGTQIELQFPL